jgi:hypothetical protein
MVIIRTGRRKEGDLPREAVRLPVLEREVAGGGLVAEGHTASADFADDASRLVLASRQHRTRRQDDRLAVLLVSGGGRLTLQDVGHVPGVGDVSAGETTKKKTRINYAMFLEHSAGDDIRWGRGGAGSMQRLVEWQKEAGCARRTDRLCCGWGSGDIIVQRAAGGE